MKTLVFNGWAAGRETWDLCSFDHDWLFDYIEELDGLPARVLKDTDSAILVGFSMGGTQALGQFVACPEKIRGLVLVSTTARMMEDRAAGWVGMSLRRREALRLGTEMLFREDPSPLYAHENLERGLDYLLHTDLRTALQALPTRRRELPVTIFQSERDGLVRPANAAYFKEIFPHAEVIMVSGAEHVLPVTIPEQIDAAVVRMQEALA